MNKDESIIRDILCVIICVVVCFLGEGLMISTAIEQVFHCNCSIFLGGILFIFIMSFMGSISEKYSG